MALKEYKQKRKFSATPEPQGGKPAATALQFVVQKHDASRLHYDFRLEMDGVLKSWAVPKGPSLNPADKRLAMMVEDHPFDYKDFEGIIPEGNYGAGTVMVWDEGTYEPLHETTGSKSAQEKELLKELKAGSLKFRMNGKKLKGEFALVHTHGRGENSWLLIKHRDKYASEEPITEKDRSVVSKKTLDQIAKNPKSKEWISNKSSTRPSASRTSASSASSAASSATKSATAKPRPSISSVTRSRAPKKGTAKSAAPAPPKSAAAAAKKTPAKPAAKKAPAKYTAAAPAKSAAPAKRTTPPSSAKAAKTRNTSKLAKAPAPAKGRKSTMPTDLAPMLATLVDKPFDEEGWSYEIKWDGYRALAYLKKGKVELRSRNNKSFEKFYPLYDALKTWTVNAVLDGEVVVLNDKGQSNFNGLQNWRSEADGELLYYVFDLLWLEGKDLTSLPLTDRRNLLKSIVPEAGMVRYSESFDTSGTEFFAAAQKMGLEGIMAKKSDSQYTPGIRTKEWLKIKTAMRQEVVIGGFTRNEGTSKLFSSLLVGVFEKGNLVYTGKIGTGFTEKMQTEMMHQFKPLIQKTSPFEHVPDVNKPSRFRPDPPDAKAVWLKPTLVCEVSFREMTEDGVMRHPSFEGMREDKPAKQVVREKAVETEKVVDEKAKIAKNAKAIPKATSTPKAPSTLKAKSASKAKTNSKSMATSTAKPASNAKTTSTAKPTAKPKTATTAKPTAKPKPTPTTKAKSPKPTANTILKPVKKGQRKTLLNPTDESQTRNIDGHDLSFTNLSKIFWPKEKYTKRDLLNYYYQVAPYILPYLNNRPQSLNRHPNGITGPSFYQKNVSGKVPDWIKTFPYHAEGDSEDKEFLVCTDEASLLYMASLGCIELNPWSSRIQQPDNPDWCIIDLDPDKKTPFDKVIEAAQVTKKVLDAAGIDSYPKTSGSTGIHIYFPLGAKYDYEHSKEFARVIVTRVNTEIPEFTSIERTVKARNGKMYLDFLQNRPQATIATAYSVRPKPGATVSAPLHWDEVKKGLKMQDFTIKTMPDRLKETGDLFKPVLGKGIDMAKALKKLEAM